MKAGSPRQLPIEIDRALGDCSNAVRKLGIAVEDLDATSRPDFEEIGQDRVAYKDLVTFGPYQTRISYGAITL